jgi:hypothetical protein
MGKLIFHIILTNDVKPVFLEELEITEEQQKFFKERLADSAQGRQYIFTEDNPPIKQLAEKIVNASDEDFLSISKDITGRFQTNHIDNTNDGVFVLSIASIKKRKLLFLIKLDHKKVYEYKVKGGKALLEEVKNTFSEDKTSIQKVALIDVDSNIVWDVLVFDRNNFISAIFANPETLLEQSVNDDFLHIRQRKDEYYNTQNIMSLCKNFVKIAEFAHEVIGEPEIIKSFNQYKSEYAKEHESDIYVHDNRNLIEQGRDEKGKFYKIYYQQEN